MIKKVLFVDDDPILCHTIQKKFIRYKDSFIVITAGDGLEAIEKLSENTIALVVTDLQMPKMDGLAALRHIMIESPVPVVVLSSLFSDGAVTFEALRLGVVDFVPKPSGAIHEDMDRSRNQIIDRVKIASNVNFENIRRVRMQSESYIHGTQAGETAPPLEYLVALGTSLSGPNTVIRLMSRINCFVC